MNFLFIYYIFIYITVSNYKIYIIFYKFGDSKRTVNQDSIKSFNMFGGDENIIV